MKRQNQKAVILTVGVVIMLIAGCSEQNISKSEIRKSRLIAVENKRLGREIEKQKELLAKCLEEKKALEEQLQKSGKGRMIDLLEAVTEKNLKLHQTIKKLKAQVEQLEESEKLSDENKKLKMEISLLEARIKQLETELQELKKPSVPQPLPSTPQPL